MATGPSWDAYVAHGPNKATLQQALGSVGGPVLILLDELMDYVLHLSDASVLDSMPGEQAFLNALMDACDDVPQCRFRCRDDPLRARPGRLHARRGGLPPVRCPAPQPQRHHHCRHGNRRLRRHHPPPDLRADIVKPPARQLADAYQRAARSDPGWGDQVLDRLGTGRGLTGLAERIENSYPFDPALMDLVQNEWGKTQGFQRVRSTVAIFALAALHWTRIAQASGWVPPLIGVGDLPLAGIQRRRQGPAGALPRRPA